MFDKVKKMFSKKELPARESVEGLKEHKNIDEISITALNQKNEVEDLKDTEPLLKEQPPKVASEVKKIDKRYNDEEIKAIHTLLKDKNVDIEVKIIFLTELLDRGNYGITKVKQLCVDTGIFSEQTYIVDGKAKGVLNSIVEKQRIEAVIGVNNFSR